MAVLGINCATENISLAILKKDGPAIEKNWQGQTIQTESLLLFLDEILKKAAVSLDDLEKIGVALGPGAFTGLRLSLVTAKTIALAKKIPLVPISTLEALAHQEYFSRVKIKSHPNKIRIILNACRGDVSTALFDKELNRLSPDEIIKPEKIKNDSEAIIIKDPLAKATAVAQLARKQDIKFNKSEILVLAPKYSHAARVNKTSKKELQHLKIGTNNKN